MTDINSNPYNFQCKHPALAARIASYRTEDIQAVFKACFGVTVNIMQKFPKPPKCKAAEYIIDNAPESLLQSELAVNKAKYENAASGNSGGRPVNKYHHDASHNNNSFQQDLNKLDASKVQIDDDVAAIVNDMNSSAVKTDAEREADAKKTRDQNEAIRRAKESDDARKRAEQNKPDADTEDQAAQIASAIADILAAGKKPSMDEDRVREIAREEDAKVDAAIKHWIDKAVKGIIAPTVCHIAFKQADGSSIVKDAGLQHKCFPMLLTLIESTYPVWIPGPAGSGKTTAVRNACKHLGMALYMPPEGPVENKYGMIGYQDASGKFVKTSLYEVCCAARDNPDKRYMYFIDECDSGYANALLVLNAVMENGYCTFANGERVEFGNNLQFCAGANTYGSGATAQYVGRNKLDDATLDRFIMIDWQYDEVLERAISGNDAWVTKVQRIRKVASEIGKYVISPRASIRGAKLLSMGVPENDVMNMTIFKGMKEDTVRNIKSRI